MVLEDEKDQVDRLCEEWRSITTSRRRRTSYGTFYKKENGWLDWSHLA
jgi:hypothetical protein